MASIVVEDFVPRGNITASKAGAGSFTAAMSRMAAWKQGNPFFVKSVLMVWETRICLLLALFTLKTHHKPEQHPRCCCQSDTGTSILQMGKAWW